MLCMVQEGEYAMQVFCNMVSIVFWDVTASKVPNQSKSFKRGTFSAYGESLNPS